MGRPPCCDKVGIKKGPWTPEEDIILVSYIQEHGPGNWRSVPTNTGLLRCSKSCRLRWTNYLRPGIKRGNFTAHEEGMIIHLQALLGNKWAAIASYLPQRTDNDIKNYWNTHLKKKLKKFQSALDTMSQDSPTNPTTQFVSKSFSDRKSSLDFTANSSSLPKLNQTTSTYASSTENISRLLEGWMRSSPKPNNGSSEIGENPNQTNTNNLESNEEISICDTSMPTVSGYKPKKEQDEGGNNDLISHEEFESILSFENLNGASWEKSTTCESNSTTSKGTSDNNNNDNDNKIIAVMTEMKQKSDNNGNPPLTFLEKWLLEESTTPEVEEVMELSPIF